MSYPRPHHCTSCGQIPSLAVALEKIELTGTEYWAVVCTCKRMRGPAGMTKLEAVVKWNDYQSHCLTQPKHPYSVVDPSGKVYSQHYDEHHANESLRGLRAIYPNTPLKVTLELDWLK